MNVTSESIRYKHSLEKQQRKRHPDDLATNFDFNSERRMYESKLEEEKANTNSTF